uniref:AMP-binding domain-containing protein n=1 Tax=Panagrellus redivivus TaxID=6233 RepID=A0A7E4ZYR4_PANRE
MEVQNPFQFTWEKGTTSNFADFFFAKIAKYGTQPALIEAETRKQWRFSEIKQFTETCGCRLREMGVNSTSRVAIVTATSPQAIFVHLANAIIGSIAVCINGFGSTDELWQQVDLSEATHCVCETQFLGKVEEVRRKAVMRGGGRIKVIKTLEEVLGQEKITVAPHAVLKKRESKSIILPKEESQLSLDTSSVTTPTNDETGGDEHDEHSDETNHSNGEDNAGRAPLFIFYSSGTTGLPKALELSHQSLIINLTQISFPIFNSLSHKERFVLPLCLHHIFGTVSAYFSLINGATTIMLNKYTTKGFLEALDEHKITQTHVTPPMIQMLAFDPLVESHNLSSLRSVIVSGAPLDANVAKICRERLQLKDIRQVYGMTELGGICTLSHVNSDNIESVGVPLPGMLVRIAHWDKKELCAPRQIGQLLVTGPQVMPVFYKNPKATAEILDSNKMVRTGDAGYYDEKGYIYVIGRIKDMIKYKGALVCPSEVESVMRSHPGIDDCAVVGRQDHVSGEVPAAFVVRNAAYPLLASAEVRQHVAGKISQFKELRGGVYFISEIPRSICGKVVRRQLKQHWDRERTVSKADNAAPAATPATPTGIANGNSASAGKPRRPSNMPAAKSASARGAKPSAGRPIRPKT